MIKVKVKVKVEKKKRKLLKKIYHQIMMKILKQKMI